MYFLYSYPKYFNFKLISITICVSTFYISYDYGDRNLEEYFHFYGIAGQKLKMKEILKINK